MKNKGYTLLELLGVIVILSVLITLVFPSVINFIKKGNDKIDSITNDLIISAAEDYINDNSSELYLTSGGKYCVSIEELIGKNYLDKSLIEDDLYTSKGIKITYTDKYNYEITDKEKCAVCKLVSDADNSNSITPGDKYQCKVKDDMEAGFEDGYYFFVLSTNQDGTTNLILERNIYYDSKNDVGLVEKITTKEVAWMGEQAYKAAGGTNWSKAIDRNMFGPVTAMNYLYKATKDWSNVSNIIINYKDEGNNYGTIITTKNITKITKKDGSPVTVLTDKQGYINLKARMPYYREVNKQAKCTSRGGSCLLWAVNYTKNSSYYKSADGKINVSELSGYWTLSTTTGNHSIARNVDYRGIISNLGVLYNSSYGVRPVITIPNNLLSN